MAHISITIALTGCIFILDSLTAVGIATYLLTCCLYFMLLDTLSAATNTKQWR